MLDKNDLNQIKGLLEQQTENFDQKLEKQSASIDKQFKSMKQEILRAIRKSENAIIAYFDDAYFELRKRVERIEEYLKLPPLTG
ncbi:hypothetical protein A2631_01175 [Candidatus Daviesbacteria bacterium RIFCSPHIGHO2_01_FULL_44_29]|uniref:Uncharacterized protein n=1 Tax=Candidatus Daviesbacteria bacterium RIFCSPHIGHO2_02_FULL_43_12 TaxID=1797776 RepID=A0A1F5KIP7_9BACT|nr:MAG: hypothetical protein A2631_01175 [Candidatus Daviesbacteria bacterium RIFCSPHIGHO2_01_FULL_44_29]OGE40350.1 MAG: hypothetical protein A3E86_01030 [Candidatus Daviesbacteria bacterium RIFCSPHIGHO2_12_FULL_47_45]OGE40714.1 MAG: hypothetical protein A3D25_05570 [Candidatus Daviesbacteria bacterium RIFCSPHIGHO2_02_FULL_43_12]OGE69789.1 MAG: hypothetical protein A3B55_05240 [Candidatus Daviesbacteria bacterium RIFCSPLOWO2_01_FULL_43_15]